MKIVRKLMPRAQIEQFAERNALTMIVSERNPVNISDASMRFYAYFDRAEVKGHGTLISAHGNGETEDAAILDYANEISGRVLVIDSWTRSRKEIAVPILVSK